MNSIVLFEKCNELINEIHKLVDTLPDAQWSDAREQTLFGFLSFYIAGKDSSEKAQEVIQKYCERWEAYHEDSNLDDIKMNIQNGYAAARSSTEEEQSLELVLETQIKKIVAINLWPDNKSLQGKLHQLLLSLFELMNDSSENNQVDVNNEPKEEPTHVIQDREKELTEKIKKLKSLVALLLVTTIVSLVLVGMGAGSASQQRGTSSEQQAEIQDLEMELLHYRNAIREYAGAAVIVVSGGDNHYHRMACPSLPQEYSFWTYNPEAAVDEGYTKCPTCMDQDLEEYVQKYF